MMRMLQSRTGHGDVASYAGRMPGPQHPHDQSAYQVRLEWGVDGLARLAPADVIVVVDVLRFSSTVIQVVERGEATALDAEAHAVSLNGAAVAQAAGATEATVLIGALRNAAAVARAILDLQHERGARTGIAVIACGELASRAPDATLRFAVEDLLGAGAVIDALATLGIDHSSPEAAVAGEGFRSLRGAARHLLTASASGRELEHIGLRDQVLAAAAVDAASVVPVLRDGVFAAL
jgi:2-phosphosulfolactate phosphatase